MQFYCSEQMQNRELNTCKQDIYSFLHFLLPTNTEPDMIRRFSCLVNMLYLIEILHQTTTQTGTMQGSVGCILLKFYIKPQLRICSVPEAVGCILLKFYIKPQQQRSLGFSYVVVSY